MAVKAVQTRLAAGERQVLGVEDALPGEARVLWAAERSLMERHGFYDALVVGSGDRALACAALGRPRDAIDTMRMGTAGARHYAAWAQRFHADVQGRVGAVDGALLHCWHGDPADRFLAATAKVYGLTLVTSDQRLMNIPGITVLPNR